MHACICVCMDAGAQACTCRNVHGSVLLIPLQPISIHVPRYNIVSVDTQAEPLHTDEYDNMVSNLPRTHGLLKCIACGQVFSLCDQWSIHASQRMSSSGV